MSQERVAWLTARPRHTVYLPDAKQGADGDVMSVRELGGPAAQADKVNQQSNTI